MGGHVTHEATTYINRTDTFFSLFAGISPFFTPQGNIWFFSCLMICYGLRLHDNFVYLLFGPGQVGGNTFIITFLEI